MGKDFKLKLHKELKQYREVFESTIKPYISICAESKKTLPWESKFGGTPYLPNDYEYPKDSEGDLMKLLAQINFEEVPDIGLFPQKGLLQFYISAADDVYGIDFDNQTNQQSFKVIYIPEITRDLSKIVTDFNFLDDLEAEYFPIGKESKLEFEVFNAPVSPEDYQFEKFLGRSAYSFFESISDDPEKFDDWYYERYSASGHKMAGYAYFTQDDPREARYKDFDILLLQIDTDDDVDIMWGDSGVANFFIKPEDLKKCDFSNVLYNWDCT